MANASGDARVGLPRDGAVASSRAKVRFWRDQVELAGPFEDDPGTYRPTALKVYVGGEYWSLMFGTFSTEVQVRTSEAGIETLIGELQAALQQARMEREAKQEMAEIVAGLRSPVPDSLEDVPF